MHSPLLQRGGRRDSLYGIQSSNGQEHQLDDGTCSYAGGLFLGVSHLQGTKYFFFAKQVEAAAGDATKDLINQLKIDIAVLELFTRLGLQFLGDALGDALGVSFPSDERYVRTESAGVSEKMAEGNRVVTVAGEFGKVFFDGVIDTEVAALVQQQHGG